MRGRILAAIFALSVSPTAVAADKPYLGYGVLSWSYEGPAFVDEADAVAAEVRAGVEWSRYMGFEARVASAPYDSLDYVIAAGLKPILPITDQSRVYGFIGDSRTSANHQDGKLRITERAYSVGFETMFDGGYWVGAEYMEYAPGSPHKMDSASVSLRFEF